MGGTIVMGDLNGDGWVDAFVAGCCYGLNPDRSESLALCTIGIMGMDQRSRSAAHSNGHIIPLDFLDGHPIREAALGDLNGDGDLDVFAAVGNSPLGTIDSLSDLILLNDGTGS